MTTVKSLTRWLDHGLSTIDTRLAELAQETAELKRMRAALGRLTNGTPKSTRHIKRTYAELVKTIKQSMRKGEMSAAQLAATTGEKYNRVWMVLRKMKKNNQVVVSGRPPHQKWTLTNGA